MGKLILYFSTWFQTGSAAISSKSNDLMRASLLTRVLGFDITTALLFLWRGKHTLNITNKTPQNYS